MSSKENCSSQENSAPPDAIASELLHMDVEGLKAQLSHRQMLIMVDTLMRWAIEGRNDAEILQLVKMARGFHQLATHVGLGWKPPHEPKQLSIIGWMVREIEYEYAEYKENSHGC